MKFNIGDQVWWAHAGQQEKWVTCPDCFGTRHLKVILGDGTELTIPCAGCAAGYEPSRGVVRSYAYEGRTTLTFINGVQINSEGVRYEVRDCYLVQEQDLFATREEAEQRSVELVQEHEAEEAERLQRKEKDTHTWAWHVHYHRRQIRDAEATIARSRQLLCIAMSKAKTTEGEVA